MLKQWNSPWNPFNSAKVLMWYKHLKGCADENYLIPVSVDIDPSNRCNFKCQWCNANGIIEEGGRDMSQKHLFELADFIATWGKNTPEGNPKSVCVAGGGEPLMNPNTLPFLERLKHNGIESGLITNGSLIKDIHVDVIAKSCRWVGFSMDAATPTTYNKIKFQTDCSDSRLFDIVCNNMRKMAKRINELGVKNDLCFKFLLSPTNYTEIYEAVDLAKSLGAKDFHLRPVGYQNLVGTSDFNVVYTPEMLYEIEQQMQAAMKLSDESFRVYGITDKFNPDFTIKKQFSRCWTIPLLPTFSADGNVYLCFDIRGRKDTILCRHDEDITEIARIWNTEKHKTMVKNIDINTCPRCTFTVYNEIVEQVINKDSMCRLFP